MQPDELPGSMDSYQMLLLLPNEYLKGSGNGADVTCPIEGLKTGSAVC